MDKRLTAIANLVPKKKVVADIGTDHAYLPIFLVEQKISKKVYACDNKEGPLNQAIEHIRQSHLEDSIFPILSDGFKQVPLDTECAVIAGMGYYTARDILLEALKRLDLLSHIIVQVNQDVPKLRKFIQKNGWQIMDEDIVEDHGKYYIIIDFNTKKKKDYSEEELYLGPCLLEKKSKVFKAYCKHEIQKIENILEYQKDPKQVEIYQKQLKMLKKVVR